MAERIFRVEREGAPHGRAGLGAAAELNQSHRADVITFNVLGIDRQPRFGSGERIAPASFFEVDGRGQRVVRRDAGIESNRDRGGIHRLGMAAGGKQDVSGDVMRVRHIRSKAHRFSDLAQ
jgi:hypothetical protein